MQLIFLTLKVSEEPSNSRKFSFAFNYQALLLWFQFGPGNIERNVLLSRKTLQIRSQSSILWLVPWIDRTFAQSLRFVRNHPVQIEVDSVAKPLATRTCPVWIIERKQARLRLFITDVANLTFKTLGEMQTFHRRLLIARGNLEND